MKHKIISNRKIYVCHNRQYKTPSAAGIVNNIDKITGRPNNTKKIVNFLLILIKPCILTVFSKISFPS